MSEIGYTPGPWSTWNFGDKVIITDDAYARHLAYMVDGARAHEHKGNGKLMAAAPDLLAALEELLSVSSSQLYRPATKRDAEAKAVAAIAKARSQP